MVSGGLPTAFWVLGLLRSPSQTEAVMEGTGLAAHVSPSSCLNAFIRLVSRHPLSTYCTPGQHSAMVRSVSSGI